MKVALEDLIVSYQENNQDELCKGCEQAGDILFPADEYQEEESVCRDCALEKLEGDEFEFQMTRYYNGQV